MCKATRGLCLAGLLTVLTMSAAHAWHGPGHMATAVVAYYDLGSVKAKKVADILRQHPDYAAWIQQKPASISEDVYLFMRAATWPDDIRASNHPRHSKDRPSWHYVNKLFKVPSNQPSPAPDHDVHIDQAIGTNESAAKTGSLANRAMALCWVFHLVGDVHQPLHSTALVSSQFPQGDRGGNSFWVSGQEGAMNLHAFWDGIWDRECAKASSMNKPWNDLRASDTDLTTIEPLATRVMQTYARSGLPELISANTFPNWINESFAKAKQKAYLNGALKAGTNAQNAEALPNGYEDAARTLGERRLALGGYRLADRLRKVLNL